MRRVVLRRLFQLPRYVRRSRAECFLCEILIGNPDYMHPVIYRDDNDEEWDALASQLQTLVNNDEHGTV